jgi:hypothetical protein
MTIVITPTEKLTYLDGVPVRLWEGVTEDGIACKVFVHRIAVHKDYNSAKFDECLTDQMPPSQWVGMRNVFEDPRGA